MAVAVEKQVLRLQIAVDNVHAVEVVYGEGNFGGVELGYRVGKALRKALVNINEQTLDDASCRVGVAKNGLPDSSSTD